MNASTIETLRAEGYRVLAPCPSGAISYRDIGMADVATLAVVDTETTSLADDAEIIQLAIQRVDFRRADGIVARVEAPRVWLEEPTHPISVEASAVHGLTLDDVRGCLINPEQVRAALSGVGLLIAHKAEFDAPKIRRRFPFVSAMAWGCSLDDVDWRAHGFSDRTLGGLLREHTECHFTGHDAGRDVQALSHVLATPFPYPDVSSPLGELLDTVRAPRVRVIADAAPYAAKDVLKARGYRWSDGTNKAIGRAWWKDIRAAHTPDERAWLGEMVYRVPDEAVAARMIPVDRAARFDP